MCSCARATNPNNHLAPKQFIDLKRRVAAECHAMHAMTVLVEDSAECESQDNGLGDVAVRDIIGDGHAH